MCELFLNVLSSFYCFLFVTFLFRLFISGIGDGELTEPLQFFFIIYLFILFFFVLISSTSPETGESRPSHSFKVFVLFSFERFWARTHHFDYIPLFILLFSLVLVKLSLRLVFGESRPSHYLFLLLLV